jgi:hypothetical protein
VNERKNGHTSTSVQSIANIQPFITIWERILIDKSHVFNHSFLKGNYPVGEAGIEHQETAAIDATE